MLKPKTSIHGFCPKKPHGICTENRKIGLREFRSRIERLFLKSFKTYKILIKNISNVRGHRNTDTRSHKTKNEF